MGKIIGGEITRTFSRGEVERNIRVDYRQFNVNGATHGFSRVIIRDEGVNIKEKALLYLWGLFQ